MANNLDEVWIAENPSLLMVYLNQYLPNLFRWYVAHYKLRKKVLWWWSWTPRIKTQLLHFEFPVSLTVWQFYQNSCLLSISRISKKLSAEIIVRSRLPKDKKSSWEKSTSDKLRKMECRTVVKMLLLHFPFRPVSGATRQPCVYNLCSLSPIMFLYTAFRDQFFKKMENAIHQINHYPVDKCWQNKLCYLLDNGLSSG